MAIRGRPFDIFTLMCGHTYHDLLAYSRTQAVFGAEIRYLGLEGLILLKSPSDREKDQLDVAVLRRLKDQEE